MMTFQRGHNFHAISTPSVKVSLDSSGQVSATRSLTCSFLNGRE